MPPRSGERTGPPERQNTPAARRPGFARPRGKGRLVCHTPAVPVARAVGRKRLMEMVLTGDVADAATALEWGMVNRVVPDAELDGSLLAHLRWRGS